MRYSGRILTIFGLVLVAAATTLPPRVNALGHQMICMCGCRQIMLDCNHLGCSVSPRMTAELEQRVQSADSDSLILQSFVQEYGTEVLANPTHAGFDQIAWVMPWIFVGLGIGLLIGFLRSMRRKALAEEARGEDES